MKEEILKQLRSEYEELEIKPSEDLWEKLDQKLDETPETVFKLSFQWWKYAAVIVLMITVGTFIYYNQYGKGFNDQRTESIGKKIKKTVNPVNPDMKNIPITVPEEPIQENDVKNVVENKKNKPDEDKASLKQKTVPEIRMIENKEPQIAVNPQEKLNTKPEKPEINTAIPPLMAEVKTEKVSYINANDLLLGNEYDKNRAKEDQNRKKFGVFNFNKVGPNIGNVTVLGVTVYIDSK